MLRNHSTGFAAVLKDEYVDCEAYNSRVIKSVVCAAYYPQILRVSHPKATYKETEGGTVKRDNVPKAVRLFGKELGQVFMHPASSLFNVSTFETGWLVYSEIMKTSKIMVRDCSMVPCYSVLIFGGKVNVEHDRGILVVDDWAKFKAPAKIAILVREMRQLVNKLLSTMFRVYVPSGTPSTPSNLPWRSSSRSVGS